MAAKITSAIAFLALTVGMIGCSKPIDDASSSTTGSAAATGTPPAGNKGGAPGAAKAMAGPGAASAEARSGTKTK